MNILITGACGLVARSVIDALGERHSLRLLDRTAPADATMFGGLSGLPAPYVSMPLTEDFEPVPEDPYSLSKLVVEHSCAAFARAHGITAIAFRFAGVVSDERYSQLQATGLPPTLEWND